MLQGFGADEDSIEKAITEIESHDYTMSLGSMIQGFLISLVIGFSIAAVIALIVKRDPPASYQYATENQTYDTDTNIE